MRHLCFILILLSSAPLHAQSLFEDAVSGDIEDIGSAQAEPYEFNGSMRGIFCGGKIPDKDEAEIKSGYGEAALKLRVRKQDFGDGFAEIRFRRGNEFNKYVSEVNLREAYVNTYVGRFDFRFGHQIVAWGRADGFNPTNNITPQNMLVRSPDEDDRREGNFLIRSFCNLKDFGYISVVAVMPEYRRRGVASALISTAIRYLKSLGLSLVKIDVYTTNTPAIEAYTKLGFQVIDAFEE